MDRKLTKQEREWLIRGLNTLGTGEYFGGAHWIDVETGETKPLDESIEPQFWFEQLDDLRVVGQCDCGDPRCHTVRFQHFEPGTSVALVVYHTTDGRMLIIHINEDSGLIAELEIV